MEMELICADCTMVFRSTELLEKHKALFCIGNEVGPLQAQRRSSELLLRDRPECRDPKHTRTPDPIEKGKQILRVQLRGQRRNIARWNGVDDKPKPARAEDVQASKTGGTVLQDLTQETSWHQLGPSERLEEMREMSTLHKHQLALIHAHNQELAQQRDELAHQMSVLSEQSYTTHLESLSMEPREHEERLQQLSEHLCASHVQEVSVHANQPDPCNNKKMHHDSYELISSADGPLSTQIKALWRAYSQSGGSDPDIVAQMIDLQAEAQSMEENQPATSEGTPQWSPSRRLLALEQENQRLEEEILRIQQRRHSHDEIGWWSPAAARTELNQRERSQEAPGTRNRPPQPHSHSCTSFTGR